MSSQVSYFGVPNFWLVDAPNNICRGAQPTKEGFDYLKSQFGIARIVKLNTDAEGSDDYAQSIGMTVLKFPIPAWRQTVWSPVQADLVSAVKAIIPGTFVHCGSDKRTEGYEPDDIDHVGGNDRTGLVIGLYRRFKMGWSKDNAYVEMIAHGFHEVLLGGLCRAWDRQTPEMWI